MIFRKFSLYSACLLCTLLWVGGCSKSGPPSDAAATASGVTVSSLEGQNLVVIVVDSLRADHVGTYGYGKPTTPFLDSLAAEALSSSVLRRNCHSKWS